MSILEVAAKTILKIDKPEFQTEQFNDRLRARDFVWQYAKNFCVYCSLTQNLYVDYDFFNTEGDRNVVVLPKNDYLSTFSRIGNSVIKNTPLMLVPNGKLSRTYLLNRRRKQSSEPAGDALQRLANDNGFMPVIMKTDLKRLKSDMPFLMLRAINLSDVSSLSTFSKQQIKTAILEKLHHT